jgi:hypothetical protein
MEQQFSVLTNEEKQKIQNFIKELVNIHLIVESGKEKVKDIKQAIKDDFPNLNPSLIVKIAKLQAQGKLQDYVFQQSEIVDFIQSIFDE